MPQTYEYWDGQTPNMFQQGSQQAVDELNERFERLQQAMSTNVGVHSYQSAEGAPTFQNAEGVPVYEIGSASGPVGVPAAKTEPAQQQPASTQQQPAVQQQVVQQPKPEPAPEPQPQPQPQPQPEPQPQPAAQQQPTPQPAAQQPAAQQQAKPAAQQQPAAAAQAQPQPQPQPAAQAQAQPQPQPVPAQQAAPQQQAAAQQQAAPQQQRAAQPAPQPTPVPPPQFAPAPAGAYGQVPPQVIYQMPPQKKSRGWIVALVLVIGLLGLAFFGVKSCSDALASTTSYGIGAGPTSPSIAVLKLDGSIQYDDSACSPEGFKQLLDEAEQDPNIKALVLRVNSGGGTATAGEEMATYLRNFSKPVVVSSAAINASAAYEISAQADWIMVAKSTEIGSIGTVIQVTDISGLMDMLGINMEIIASADSKDSSYGYRPLTDEERAYYQHMVTQINDMFIENVATGRGMEIDQVRPLANGLAYTGVDAVENGLADEVGTLDDACKKAAALAGLTEYEVYDLSLTSYDWYSLYDMLGSSSEDQKVVALLNDLVGRMDKRAQ